MGSATAIEASLDPLPLTIAGREFRSRLMVGTGKYASNGAMTDAIEASGAEVVTVAVRRVDLDRANDEGILHHLDPERFFLLANTAGCYSADEAIRYARLARAAGFNEWVKLEVIGDQQTLLPDTAATIEATRDFKGVFHVLLGALSPLKGVGPHEIDVAGVIKRVQAGGIREVIIATNPNVEGEATALYLARRLKPLGVKVTRLAFGLPVGAALEFADEVTLSRSLLGRREI